MRRMWMLLLVLVLTVIVMAVPTMAAGFSQNDDGSWPEVTSCPCGMVVDGEGEHVNGCSKETVVWLPWTQADIDNAKKNGIVYSGTSKNTTGMPVEGNYYLTCNLTIGGQSHTKKGASKENPAVLRINFNGFKVSTSSNRGFWLCEFSTLHLTDTSAGQLGGIYNTAKHDQGGIVWFNAGNTKLYMYGGTYDASGFANQSMSANGGSAIEICSTGAFYMYGGTLIAPNASSQTIAANPLSFVYGMHQPNSKNVRRLPFNGAAIYSNGTVEIWGGTIIGGDVQPGWAIGRGLSLNNDSDTSDTVKESAIGRDVNGDGDMNDSIKESEVIKSGTWKPARGGAIYVNAGSFTMKGGTIYGGNALAGSGTYTNDKLEVKTEYAAGYGGAIFVLAGTVNLNGGSIIGGTAQSITYTTVDSEGKETQKTDEGKGGVLYVHGGTVNLNGTVIAGQNETPTAETTAAAVRGGLIYVHAGTLNLNSGTVKNGKADKGGAIYVEGGAVKLQGATVENSWADMGGNFMVVNGSLQITSGTIQYGHATSYGGNLHQESNTVTMSGGFVKNGTATQSGSRGWGANISINGGTFKLQGGTIESGNSKKNGGNIYQGSNGTLTITGGTVQNGVSADQGGNIFISGNCTIDNASILNGRANNGGNIAVNSPKAVKITNSTITGGTSTAAKDSRGGNINISSQQNGGSLELGVGNVIHSGTAAEGRNVYVTNNTAGTLRENYKTTLIISGGTISAGTTTSTCYDVGVKAQNKAGTTCVTDLQIIGSDAGTVVGTLLCNQASSVTITGANVNSDADTLYSLKGAANAAEENEYVILAGDLANQTVETDCVLDLNGKTITGLTVTGDSKISLFDNSGSGYDVPTGSVTLAGGQDNPFVREFLTGDVTTKNMRYVTIKDGEGNFSAHRIYLAVKATTLHPKTVDEKAAMGYRIALRCDDVLATYISGYGLQVGTTEDNTVTVNLVTDEKKVSGDGANNDNSKVVGVMFGTSTTLGETDFTGCAYMKLSDALATEKEAFTSAGVTTSLKTLVEGAFAKYNALNDTLKAQLDWMKDAYSSVMSAWNTKVEN